ncbi:hypothetical protein DSO57_1020867 [Entomophthora muscae]|uniref:Uncharacterized protein n=1 Tax=Entomophthora muscae TaxID=34485 RepID=A0ACC2RIE5_9FUNG|nr:hypothetical protein DSO57_1020867 [Entomophthora muscae]
MVLTTGAASPLVTHSHVHSLVLPPLFLKYPRNLRRRYHQYLLNSYGNGVISRACLGPLPAFSLNYEQACAATLSLLYTGTMAMHTIPGLCPEYASKDLYSFLFHFGLPLALMDSIVNISMLVNQFIHVSNIPDNILVQDNIFCTIKLNKQNKNGSSSPYWGNCRKKPRQENKN